MGIPDGQTRPALQVIVGETGRRAVLIDPAAHTGQWAEAWQLHGFGDGLLADDEHRMFLIRIEIDGRHGIGFAAIDDAIVRAAKAAGLTRRLGIMSQFFTVLPEALDELSARWVMRFLARKAVRDLPCPPAGDRDREAWRSAIDVLADVAVNGR